MKTVLLAFSLLTSLACGSTAYDNSCAATATCPPPTSDAGTSVCVLPSTGGLGSACSAATPDAQSWVWMNTSQTGEQSHRCNATTCPTGATCIVQSDMSGQNNGGELLFGTCQ